MPKYRKKPVVIEAVQWFPDKEIKGVCFGPCALNDFDGLAIPRIHTMHAKQTVFLEPGDWVIGEPDGIHFYPCKPDIFEQTYEQVNEDA